MPLSPTKPITLADVEALAREERRPVLEVLTLLQTGAAALGDDEKTLEALCALKADYLARPFMIGIGTCPSATRRAKKRKPR